MSELQCIDAKACLEEDSSKKVNACQEDCDCEYTIVPRYQAWFEDKTLEIRVILPGVDKKDIELKALKDTFLLRAKRGDISYKLDLDLDIDIDVNKIKAEYHEGLLKVSMVRIDPIDTALDVPIA